MIVDWMDLCESNDFTVYWPASGKGIDPCVAAGDVRAVGADKHGVAIARSVGWPELEPQPSAAWKRGCG